MTQSPLLSPSASRPGRAGRGRRCCPGRLLSEACPDSRAGAVLASSLLTRPPLFPAFSPSSSEVWCEEVLWPPLLSSGERPCGPPGALHSHRVRRVTPGRTRGPLPRAEVHLGTKAEGGAGAQGPPQTPIMCVCVEVRPTRRPGCVLDRRHPVLQLVRNWPRFPDFPATNPTLCTPGSGLH